MSCIKSRCWDFGVIENRCYKFGLRLVIFAVLISADIVQKMATEAMVTKFECYSYHHTSYILSYIIHTSYIHTYIHHTYIHTSYIIHIIIHIVEYNAIKGESH